MVFSSIPFLFFFFPLFLFFYYIVPFKIKNHILLIFSLIFYAWGEPTYILLMVFSSFINYYISIKLNKLDKQVKKKKLVFILSIIINILILSFFKYADFLIQNINYLLNTNISTLKLGLPIGISFFTFQTMSYTIDVYKKEVIPETNFLTFTTYVSMFPQLIAGPIVRYETVSKELHKRTISFSNFSNGLLRFFRGLFKKVLIANNIGYLWNIISNLQNLSFLSAWLGILAFTLQIYFDFSGYSDMAIGMGKMLGFNYLENFNYPYIATSITDFWRRWHISLSSWFKDYVYIPLGGSRVRKILNIRNLLVVWMLTGLWHGASWNFVIWGLYYGILLIIEKFILNKYIIKFPRVVKHLYTLILIMIGWLIFAFDDIGRLSNYIKFAFGLSGKFIDNAFIYYFKNYFIIISFACLFSTPFYNNIEKHINTKLKFFFISIFYVILLIITISYLISDTYNPFLYFRF